VNSYNKRLKQTYPDCWQWISLAQRFPGQLTENEVSSLFRLARARTPSIHPVIVELSSGGGKATLLLAAALRTKTNPQMFSFQQIPNDGIPAIHRTLRRCRLGHIVQMMLVDPHDAAANWQDGIDVLFISAGEDDEALRSDLSLWLPLLKPGGILVLHGAAPSAEPVLKAPGYEDFRRVDNLIWVVRRCAEIGQENHTMEIAMAGLQDYVRRAAKEHAENRHALEALRRSWSWRLTAPLRRGIEIFQAIAGIIGSFGHGSAKSRIDGLAQWLRFGSQVRASGLLDERFYRDRHPGVAWARSSPLLHFFMCGAMQGTKPNELFDLEYYLARYPDVAQSGMNPLVHYLKKGAYEGRDPHPLFDSSFYLEQNPDVRQEQLNPLAHYLAPGIAEGRDPNPWFDTSEYLEQNPDVAAFGVNPLWHHLWHQGEASRQP
jgi:predicted O-methyltransferase YrrM